MDQPVIDARDQLGRSDARVGTENHQVEGVPVIEDLPGIVPRSRLVQRRVVITAHEGVDIRKRELTAGQS